MDRLKQYALLKIRFGWGIIKLRFGGGGGGGV